MVLMWDSIAVTAVAGRPPRRITAGAEIPVIQTCFSRRGGSIKSDVGQRQKTQIVQSWLTLDDLLP